MDTNDMRVTKRNGQLEEIAFDKIQTRIKKLGQEASININYQQLVIKVIDQLYDKISTTKIDELVAEQCASLSTLNPDYGTLSGRIIVSNHQKNTDPIFSNVMRELYNFNDIHGKNSPLVSLELWKFVSKYYAELDNMIDHNRDYLIDYFGFKTLERSYLFKNGKNIIERPQHMWMRVAVGIHGDLQNPRSLELIKETYDLMSNKFFTHATPTLFNAGTRRSQMSSCYLLAMEDDSIEGIFNTLKDCAIISKYSGGIGLHIHNIRSKGSHIQGTNGMTDGIVPMLRVFNNTARYVNQCFTPDTWVYSKNGPTEIKNITTDDELITIDGTFKKVNQVVVNNINKEILEIKITNSLFPVSVTKEHELYLIKNQSELVSLNDIKKQLISNVIQPSFFPATELTNMDLVGFPLPTWELDNDNDNLDYYKFYGMMLRDGYISTNNKTSGITLGLNTETILTEFTEKFLDKNNIKYITYDLNNSKLFKWDNDNNNMFFRELLYDDVDNKQIFSDFLHLPHTKIIKIIEGLLKTTDSTSKEICFYTSSQKLVMQFRYLLLRLGVLTSGCIKDSNSNETTSTSNRAYYCLRIPKHPSLKKAFNFNNYQEPIFNYFEWKGILWGRIERITQKTYNGPVYDFNMIDNHNYLTDMGLVHNSGKRNGSFAIYLEPWHADIFDFLELRKNHGDEELKARDLFYALWVSDLFMERVKEKNGKWSLMCPHECPGLSDVYGDEFKTLYEKYENEGMAKKTIVARDLWFAILDAQMETGTPYLLYKDAVNMKSNQKNLGTIKSSNLCCEITQYSDNKETAVCNLASIALPAFVNETLKTFDFAGLHNVTKVIANNLNRVIDINFYPTEKTLRSNMRHRPMGIGIQGLADTFILLDIPFYSDKAKELNKQIFETIYHAALEKSNEMAIERSLKLTTMLDGSRDELLSYVNKYEHSVLDRENKDLLGAYSTFEGSPASEGILQFDMWSVTPSTRYDWDYLKRSIKNYGLRNSLLVAPMPTASTSQILGYNECFEPLTSNLYSRRTLAGEFVIVNKYLMKELIQLGQWNEQIKNNIVLNKGSIQQLTVLPQHIRDKYKIIWEIPMKHIIDMAADRGPFICQSQSLNLWMEDPVYNKLTSMHFYAWSKGLKTGIYYLRRKAKHQAQQFTIEPDVKETTGEQEEICEMCSA